MDVITLGVARGVAKAVVNSMPESAAARAEAAAEAGEANVYGVGNVAEEFDPTESYTAGMYVFNNAKLYRFTASHTGVWTGTDAVEAVLANDLTNLINLVNHGIVIGETGGAS